MVGRNRLLLIIVFLLFVLETNKGNAWGSDLSKPPTGSCWNNCDYHKFMITISTCIAHINTYHIVLCSALAVLVSGLACNAPDE